MASIQKRKNNKYSVIYDVVDKDGKRKQKWETFSTNAEAKRRKNEIEHQQDNGIFVIPTVTTVAELLEK